MKKPILVVSTISAIGLALWLVSSNFTKNISIESKEVQTDQGSLAEASSAASVEQQLGVMNDGDDVDDETRLLSSLADEMRSKFGPELDHPLGKLKMIADLRNWFMEQFPDDWLVKLMLFLQTEFPEEAEKLVAMLEGLLEYEAFGQNLDLTQFESNDALQQYMWEKRQHLFGDESEVIWADEHKARVMRDKVRDLEDVAGNFGELQQQYVDSRKSVYGDNAFVEQSSEVTNMLSEFLTLNNVQGELHNMEVGERKTALRDFRKNLGMDSEALDRWEALDEKREVSWSNGEEYMSKRVSLSESYSGDELMEKVYELQNEFFSESQATNIRNEEATGFFRFKRQRTIGLN